jgi:hypothetical protein
LTGPPARWGLANRGTVLQHALTGGLGMSWMDRVRESQQVFRGQVRANALEEGGLQPVVFLLAKDTVAPVVLAEAGAPQEIYAATDRLAREMGAEAAILAFEMLARRTDTVEAFRDVVEEGAIRRPSQSADKTPAVLWHRFAAGRCETELDVYDEGRWRSHGTKPLDVSPLPYFRTDRGT